MALSLGTKLGPYEVIAAIGAGGMGEVYRATDTRLDRSVAIKVLPAEVSGDVERRQRFEREARTISSLNHPNICGLYDLGSQDGIEYLVLEYVEGETLEKRIVRGPLPAELLLRCGVEIADALEKAHRNGVVHRDLKPANVMLTKSGAKLLDFGLAKWTAAGASEEQTLKTLTEAPGKLTERGTILGTFQYMAPEQLEGKEADTRTDLFALGEVLYEMATGCPAFAGKTKASLIAAILTAEPAPMTSLQPLAPPALERLVRGCLAKDPDERWQTAHDVKLQLRAIAEGGSQVMLAPADAPKGIRARWPGALLWVVVSLLLAAITGLAIWNLKPSPPLPVSRTVITLPPGQRLAGLDQHAVALSPDGTQLVYVAIQGSTQQLYLRAIDSLESRVVPGTEGAVNPFFSPDGQWLGFFAEQKLKKVSLSGGAPLTLSDVWDPEGASWGSQGVIAFVPSTVSALQQVPDTGGAPQPLARLEKGEGAHRWPEFLPSGKAVLFASGAISGNWARQKVAVQSLQTGKRENLIEQGMSPAYAPSGHLVYAQGGSLMAVPFDSQRLAVTGTAVPVVEGVLQASTGAAQYSVSASGSLVYVSGGHQADQRRFVWVTRNGAEQPLAAPPRRYSYPRLSPDGRRVAVGITEQDTQIWLYDLSREALTRLTMEGNVNGLPAWTADGQRVSFQSNKDGPLNMFWQRADGGGGPERLRASEDTNVPMSWSPDGQLLAFGEINPTTGFDIWVMRMSDRNAQPFLRTSFNESSPRFSPDGRWLSYASDETGRQEIYVQPYPGPGGKWQVSTEGGREAIWNRNGRELFYRIGDKMMVVDIATQPNFAPGKPRVLFEGQYEPTVFTVANYDVSPDGQRFLMLKRSEAGEAAPTQINVVLNWFEELKRRVPTGKK